MSEVLALYNELRASGVLCYDWEMGGELAAVVEVGSKQALFVDTSEIETEAEETVVVAHEAGHIKTGALHKIESPYDLIEKHEHKADAWAYRRLMAPAKLKAAFDAGCREAWELADYLNLPQHFVEDGIAYFKTQTDLAS